MRRNVVVARFRVLRSGETALRPQSVTARSRSALLMASASFVERYAASYCTVVIMPLSM
jgi:hypothetical protein